MSRETPSFQPAQALRHTPVSASPVCILHEVQWQLPDGTTLWKTPLSASIGSPLTGMVGRNGVGKSVLVDMLNGRLQPASGHVERLGNVHVLRQAAGWSSDAAAADVAGLGCIFTALQHVSSGEAQPADWELAHANWDLPQRWQRAVADAGLPPIDPEMPAGSLSGGQQQRVALLGAFLSQVDLLILDEPSNHLDAEARRWLQEQLRRWPGHVLVVSHDRALLAEADRILELSEAGLRTYGGGYAFYQQKRNEEVAMAHADLDHAKAARDRIKREIARQHDAQQRRAAKGKRVGRTANLPGVYLTRLKDNAQAFDGREAERREQALEGARQAVRAAAEQVTDAAAIALALPASTVPAGRIVLELRDLRLPFVEARPLNLSITGPERIALSGPNGSGKSTLLRVIAGQLAPEAGVADIRVPFAWLDQTNEALLPPALSVLQRLEQLHSPLGVSEQRTRLAQLGLGAACVTRPSGQLSGGERMKAALACVLWSETPAQLLLLDEPSNHLDLASIEALEVALAQFGGALLVATHDHAFARGLGVTRVWDMAASRWDEEAGWLQP